MYGLKEVEKSIGSIKIVPGTRYFLLPKKEGFKRRDTPPTEARGVWGAKDGEDAFGPY